MGKAMPKAIKMRSETLMKLLPQKFSTDFERNKSVLGSLGMPLSKTDRNLIAGFIARKMSNAES